MTHDALALAQALIRCPSVTPADAGAQDVLAGALLALGFEVHRLRFGEAPDGPIDNLFATYGSGSPHFAFAGHTDVVPTGDIAQWSADPFAAEIADGQLIGRGAADMKGAIAAFVAAAARHVERSAPGRVSLIITGDEEGPATFGTQPMLTWLEAQGLVPDMCLVGEPTSAQQLGDTIKIGRRGSLNAWITVNGAQGHVAYPQRAGNPVTRLVAALADLKARVLDSGSDWFDASNLEITDIGVGNPATNVIPAQARARINIRFNDLHRGPDLSDWVRETVSAHAPSAEIIVRISGEAFLTEPGPLSDIVTQAVLAVTGTKPALSTSGGTSDARFIRRLCPVVEFGLVGASMHKADESVAVTDLAALADIYDHVLQQVFTR
ncbi:succinyl-diaminopimelate desuccinylase [Polymorphobacter glacialis]|uniref:Succinyl-diaminopimelate desuccinylase n=1 Tax=Sandarakinorhabdus glacialis TaxID=1614636 RepID=A0A917E8W1_9SPHN|nr:succinyl-diaminopimelate desuccinylase [Polymorphobacter glacialis]GGE10780.1 succinyl-diaminopimelate desuccinylase [Polymorphobacter glacialis]